MATNTTRQISRLQAEKARLLARIEQIEELSRSRIYSRATTDAPGRPHSRKEVKLYGCAAQNAPAPALRRLVAF